MKKLIRIVSLSLVLCFAMTFFPYTVYAKGTGSSFTEIGINGFDSSSIIGGSDNLSGNSTHSNPNMIVLYYTCTADGFNLQFTNFTDPIDSIYGTITIGAQKVNFNFYNVSPYTSTFFVPFPMVSCHERIDLQWSASDDGWFADRVQPLAVGMFPNFLLKLGRQVLLAQKKPA